MSNMTIHSAVLSYLDELNSRGCKPLTVSVYDHELVQAWGFLGGDNKMSSLTPARVARYLRSDAALMAKDDRPLAKNTKDRRWRVFRGFLRWAVVKGLLAEVPWPEEPNGQR